MPKTKKGVLEEVMQLEQKMEEMRRKNPDDPAFKALETLVMKKRESDAFQKALEDEEKRMGDELKKLFQE